MDEGTVSTEVREAGHFQVLKSVQEVAGPIGPAEPQDLRMGSRWAWPTVKEWEGGTCSLHLNDVTQRKG